MTLKSSVSPRQDEFWILKHARRDRSTMDQEHETVNSRLDEHMRSVGTTMLVDPVVLSAIALAAEAEELRSSCRRGTSEQEPRAQDSHLGLRKALGEEEIQH